MARHKESRTRRRSRSPRSCRPDHAYGPSQEVGAGILRLVCRRCGAVSIDLTEADGLTSTGSLFEHAEGTLRLT
jgi:hypothetical protein